MWELREPQGARGRHGGQSAGRRRCGASITPNRPSVSMPTFCSSNGGWYRVVTTPFGAIATRNVLPNGPLAEDGRTVALMESVVDEQ